MSRRPEASARALRRRAAFLGLVTAAGILSGGCAHDHRGGKPGDAPHASDLSLDARVLTSSMLEAVAVPEPTPPVVSVHEIDNRTGETVDTHAIAEAIREVLRRSERVRFAVDAPTGFRLAEEARTQSDVQQASGASAGAREPVGWYRIEGSVVTSADEHKSRPVLVLILRDNRTAKVVWSSDVPRAPTPRTDRDSSQKQRGGAGRGGGHRREPPGGSSEPGE